MRRPWYSNRLSYGCQIDNTSGLLELMNVFKNIAFSGCNVITIRVAYLYRHFSCQQIIHVLDSFFNVKQ